MFYNLKFKKFILSLGAISLLIFFHYLGWLNPIESTARTVIKPIYSFFYSAHIKLNNRYKNLKNKSNQDYFYTKYYDLKLKNEELKIKNTNLKLKNEELKKIVNFKENNKYNLISSKVIGRNNELVGQSLIIDIGSEDDVKVGQPAVIMDGILIGIVRQVYHNSSLIELLNDNNTKIAASIFNDKKSTGVVEGGYGLSIKMKLIPRNEIVIVGDKVITSGLESNIPRGLLIGEVEVTENEPYQPFQTAIISPTANLSNISLVSIIISNLEKS